MAARRLRRWLFAAGTVALVIVAAIVVRTAIKRRDAARVPTTFADLVVATQPRAKAFARAVDIDPFGLTARTPDGWTCERSKAEWVVQCAERCWTVSWDIEPETAAEPTDALIAALKGYGAGDEEPAAPIDLAGFHGGLFETVGFRRPSLDYVFTGWLDDATRGRLRLTVTADACYATERQSIDGLAVVLTTSAAPGGIAKSWPSKASRADNAQAERYYGFLADDSKPDGWIEGASYLVSPRSTSDGDPPGTRVGDSLGAREPSVATLIVRRIETLSADASIASFDSVIALARSLARWDPASAHAALSLVATKLRDASNAGLDSKDAGHWIDLECAIAEARATTGEPAAVGELARWLVRLDPRAALRNPRGTVRWLLQHHDDTDVAAVLNLWLDPTRTKPPPDADFASLADTCASWVTKVPVVRRHVLAMLSNRAPHGTLELRADNMMIVHTPTTSWGTALEPGELAHVTLGTTMSLRVCDHYARTQASGRRDGPSFSLWEDVAARDRAIAEVRAYVAAAR